MKTIRWILSLILLTSILCGCSSLIQSNQTPYLDQKERAAIEQSILNGMKLIAENNSTQISLQNDSNYTLFDVEFVSSETQTIFFSLPLFEKKMNCNLEIYSQELLEADNNTSIYMVYTIGDYTYYSDLMVPVKKTDASISDTASAYHITLDTKDGMVELDTDKPLDFFAGTEISGLKKFRINSITTRVPYDGAIDFDLTGSRPNDWSSNLTAKLRDDDGIIVSSSSVYLSDGKGTIYCFDVDPGNYTLTFEETN